MPDRQPDADERRPPSEEVVTAVATAFDTSPLDLTPPLYDRVDPEALDSLVRSGPNELRVQFRYNGCAVSIDGRGRTEVSPIDESARSHECEPRDD
ncbi:HalOD1 output domain-containing protein [Natrinema salaciae]|uniref:Halobacterial output domain-containing protein n=1 Tax=Natrinema salaciae TaxID=1186196 RepID=A0A1H9H2R6_9EURY|nr:HalOD1 output domain-containing protein [Natrinema salaciae]SEQ56631.1 hypothetical protein SAMN04489841_2075 [Natrinema salaciae]